MTTEEKMPLTSKHMISVTKQNKGTKLGYYLMYATATNVRTTGQMHGRIMRCMQPWLLKLFVALVALQLPDATEPGKTTTTTMAMTTAKPMTRMEMAMVPMVVETYVTASSVGDITSEAYKAIKPIGIKTTNTIKKTKGKTTIAQTNTNQSDVISSSNNNGEYYQNGTAGIMATLESPLEKVQDLTQNLSNITIETTTTRTSTGNMSIMASLNDSLTTDQIQNIEPTDMNMSFHEYCLANRDSFADLLTIVLYSIVCIIGLFGNTLVIYVVLRFSKMQTVTNIYILNLAIADECFLIGIPFLLYTMRICSWTFGEYMCKAYMVSTSITQFTSSIFLLIMSADRFIAVCHPIASPRFRTIRIAKLVSAVAWLTSAILMLPVILFASTITQEDGIHHSCNIKWPESHKHTGTTFILYTFFLGFATPLCFILCFYYLVIKKLHAVGRKHKSKEKKRSHRKVTRLVLTVITVYVLCWLPQWISQVALINSSPGQSDLSRFEVMIFLLLGCLAYSNSAMNPILYAFLSDNFRKSFSKAFTCMAGHEVNAQLQVEPSVFTKHGGSRRRGSKRLIAQSTTKTAKAALLSATPGNNNSSTTTSSTTTQAEKHTVAIAMGGGTGTAQATITTASNATKPINDLVTSLQTTKNGLINTENVVLVLVKQETICATLVERRNQSNQMSGRNTLQTDL